jgi:hypothetical protein
VKAMIIKLDEDQYSLRSKQVVVPMKELGRRSRGDPLLQ